MHDSKNLHKFYISLITAMIGVFLIALANFLPLLYFGSVGFPTIEKELEGSFIFTVAQILGYTGIGIFSASIVTMVYSYIQHKKSV